MNLSEVCASWMKRDPWNRAMDIVTVGGTVIGILSLTGVHMHLTEFAILVLICGLWLLFYINNQQSRKLVKATGDLGEVNSRIDQATKAVYDQKNREIRELDVEVATWKDRAASWQEKATSSKMDVETLSGQLRESQNSLQKEQKRGNTLEMAYRHLNNAYRKKEGITEGSVSTKFNLLLIKDGSPLHLKNISQDVSYEEAKKLAKEAGISDDA
jgi:hypothetical protein